MILRGGFCLFVFCRWSFPSRWNYGFELRVAFCNTLCAAFSGLLATTHFRHPLSTGHLIASPPSKTFTTSSQLYVTMALSSLPDVCIYSF